MVIEMKNIEMFLFTFLIIIICGISGAHSSTNQTSYSTLQEEIETKLQSDLNATTTSVERKLKRQRRYLVFPQGSSFSVAICLTVGMYGNPSFDWISWAINWGLGYNLPNETYAATLRRKAESDMSRSITLRRNRRDLYQQLELIIDNMGFNGRECILRALCETSQLFGAKGATMIKEMLRTVFSLPATKVLPFEHPDLILYDKAHRKGKRLDMNCAQLYYNCGFSLHGMALGKYSEPPPLPSSSILSSFYNM